MLYVVRYRCLKEIIPTRSAFVSREYFVTLHQSTRTSFDKYNDKSRMTSMKMDGFFVRFFRKICLKIKEIIFVLIEYETGG